MASRSTAAIDQPGDDTIEVSVFGPGRGEAVAVHLGHGDWITVDSCVNQRTNEHALLDYFSAIDIDVAHQVKLVIATHAHDDHIAGIAEMYKRATQSRFVLSAATTAEEFFATVAADASIERYVREKIRAEYKAVREEAMRRRAADRGAPHPLMEANEGRVIFDRASTPITESARVTSLTPSDNARDKARQLLAEGTAMESGRKRLSAGDPNEFSVALEVRVADEVLLLGADLLKGPRGAGWQGVMSSGLITTPASYFKVSHHGSQTGHLDAMWQDALSPNVLAVLTPYRAGVTPIPKDADLQRIRSFTPNLYASALTAAPALTNALRKTAQTFGTLGPGIVQNVRDPDGQFGHVRARKVIGASKWEVDLFGPATRH